MKIQSLSNGLAMMLAAAILTACAGRGEERKWSDARTEMEQKGQDYLEEARAALAHGSIDKAKATVEKMRKECTLALDAREEGILLMDSIDLKQAVVQLEQADSIGVSQPELEDLNRRVQFYKRKLDHDKQNRRKH